MINRRVLFSQVIMTFVGIWILPTQCPAEIMFDARQIQLTANSADKRCTAFFHFKNIGSKVVTITSLHPTCGCTTAELDKFDYAPGEAGEIKAVFTFDGRVGLQEKMIQVSTDDAPNNPIPLTLRVDILEPLTCSSHFLLWRIGDEFNEKCAIITPANSRKIIAIKASASSADVTARIEATGDDGKYRLYVRPTSSTKLINVTIDCRATFVDGTVHAFIVSAFVR